MAWRFKVYYIYVRMLGRWLCNASSYHCNGSYGRKSTVRMHSSTLTLTWVCAMYLKLLAFMLPDLPHPVEERRRSTGKGAGSISKTLSLLRAESRSFDEEQTI